MTFRSIAVAGWGDSTAGGVSLGDGDEVFAAPGGAVAGPGAALEPGAPAGPGGAVGLGAGVGLGPAGGFGADVVLVCGGDPPPMETGVAAPRFVAGAIAAM